MWPEYGAAAKWLAESRVRPHLLKTRAAAAQRDFFVVIVLTRNGPPNIYPTTGAPHCPGVMARLSKHLTCNSEPSFRSVVGGRNASTVSISPAFRGGGLPAPGCLKSESEERETWTAESLRAASGDRSSLRSKGVAVRILRRSTFQGTSQPAGQPAGWMDLVKDGDAQATPAKTCDQPRSIS